MLVGVKMQPHRGASVLLCSHTLAELFAENWGVELTKATKDIKRHALDDEAALDACFALSATFIATSRPASVAPATGDHAATFSNVYTYSMSAPALWDTPTHRSIFAEGTRACRAEPLQAMWKDIFDMAYPAVSGYRVHASQCSRTQALFFIALYQVNHCTHNPACTRRD